MTNLDFSPAIQLIAQERLEQIEKHGFTVDDDLENNLEDRKLIYAAQFLLRANTSEGLMPDGWDADKWRHMINKPFEERLVIAAAFIAAHLDMVKSLEDL